MLDHQNDFSLGPCMMLISFDLHVITVVSLLYRDGYVKVSIQVNYCFALEIVYSRHFAILPCCLYCVYTRYVNAYSHLAVPCSIGAERAFKFNYIYLFTITALLKSRLHLLFLRDLHL